MPLPSGVTLIPRKTVSKVASNFPLLGRNSNIVAGDTYLFGNPYNAHPSAVRESTKRVETLRNDGELSAAVVGEDIRAWMQINTDTSGTTGATCVKPGSVVFWAPSVGANADYIFQANSGLNVFQPGDQVTFVNLSTYRIDLYFSAAGSFVGPGSSTLDRIRFKASNVGASVTLERCYIDATAKTLGWRIVAATGAIGTLADANPIGVQ